MKKLFLILIVFLAFACKPTPSKTYTVEYVIQTVSQYNDTTIIYKTVQLNERKVEIRLRQGDLTFLTMHTNVSGEGDVLMSGVKYYVVLKIDTLNVH